MALQKATVGSTPYYGDHSAAIEIETLRIIKGQLPQRVLGLVLEWASLHRDELLGIRPINTGAHLLGMGIRLSPTLLVL